MNLERVQQTGNRRLGPFTADTPRTLEGRGRDDEAGNCNVAVNGEEPEGGEARRGIGRDDG
jgi:hypothetical protein